MALATLDDVNNHLPVDKIQMVAGADFNQYLLDVERIIKGALSNTYSASTLAGWSDPTVSSSNAKYVPGMIRSIAGRFIASFFYAKRFSEETTETSPYAQKLYDDALGLLTKIIDGEITLYDETDEIVETGGRLNEDDFFPNDPIATPPVFAMDKQF
jgi:hypothetical protein